MSSKILAQRSAIPALHSRTSKLTSHIKITREEKAKLLRMGKRKVKGPFNTYVDPSELGAGSAVMEPSEAVKNSGKYDAWGAAPDPTKMLKGKGKFTEPEDYLLPLVQKPIPKVCIHFYLYLVMFLLVSSLQSLCFLIEPSKFPPSLNRTKEHRIIH